MPASLRSRAMPYRSMSLTQIPGLTLIHRGKVRDVYALPGNELLIVASDRLSAFDVILPDAIPGKGEILTQLSNFWFAKTADWMPNHLSARSLLDVLPRGTPVVEYERRSVVAKRLKPVPVEAIARGYIIGSGWKDYQASGRISGVELPKGLQLAERLREPIFTPSTKAAVGEHDENIGFDDFVAKVGGAVAEQVRDLTLKLYAFAADYARERGIIIADTKFEFGIDEQGMIRVMDEILTPDSSRFWNASEYRVGISPPSFDKQFVRDYLETLNWNKQAPGPMLPQSVIAGTRARYAEALQRLAGITL
jgi:phosphoribosylaminoimidazole-succinocarboxamide synthase